MNYPLGANEDSSAPWHESDAKFKECPECKGDQDFGSECCEAPIEHTICTKCKEHASLIYCPVCNGEGCVPFTDQDCRDEEDRLREMHEDKDD